LKLRGLAEAFDLAGIADTVGSERARVAPAASMPTLAMKRKDGAPSVEMVHTKNKEWIDVSLPRMKE
jgi:hypothetical protein